MSIYVYICIWLTPEMVIYKSHLATDGCVWKYDVFSNLTGRNMTNQWIQTYPSFRQTCIIYIYTHIYAYNGLLTYLSYIYTDISQMPISSFYVLQCDKLAHSPFRLSAVRHARSQISALLASFVMRILTDGLTALDEPLKIPWLIGYYKDLYYLNLLGIMITHSKTNQPSISNSHWFVIKPFLAD